MVYKVYNMNFNDRKELVIAMNQLCNTTITMDDTQDLTVRSIVQMVKNKTRENVMIGCIVLGEIKPHTRLILMNIRKTNDCRSYAEALDIFIDNAYAGLGAIDFMRKANTE